MPAFTPLAATNEKTQPLDVAWSHNDDDDDNQSLVLENRGIISSIFNSRAAQHAKLLVLTVLALVHFYYLNDFLVKFAAVDRLIYDANNVKHTTISYRLHVATMQYNFQGFIDYKKNLWITVGAMCASLATTASLLTIYNGPRDSFNRAAKTVMLVFDLCAFLFIGFLLFARISAAVVILHTTPQALRAATRISSTLVTDLGNNLACTIEPRDNLPLCSQFIIDSIFPVKLLEYLIILCLLTGAYIGLAYLIEWCIRHFFPPSHAKLTPISAISRNLIAGSKTSDSSVLIVA